jgi:uncharacterized protein
MASAALDEDTVDDILYFARTNEVADLDACLGQLSAQTNRSRADLVGAARDPYSKNTALHYAAGNGHLGMSLWGTQRAWGPITRFLSTIANPVSADVIKLVLPSGPDSGKATCSALINTVNDAGNTALHWAALNGHLECVKYLVQTGADVTIINQAGHDAVFEAEINDKKEVVDWLLGEVEELEKGISKAEDKSGEGGEGTPHSEQASGADVEDVRKQIAAITTNAKGNAHG